MQSIAPPVAAKDADPSTPLRSAQDDTVFWFLRMEVEGERAADDRPYQGIFVGTGLLDGP